MTRHWHRAVAAGVCASLLGVFGIGSTVAQAAKARTVCVALVDVSAPHGTPAPVAEYQVQLQTFYEECAKDHAIIEIFPLLNDVGTRRENYFQTAASDRVSTKTKCAQLLKKLNENPDDEGIRERVETCITKFKAANQAIQGFIKSLTTIEIDKTVTTTEILGPMQDAAGIFASAGGGKRHLLVLSPGFQTSGSEYNFNLENEKNGISSDSAGALVDKAFENGSVANLKGVDVKFAGLTELPGRPISETYRDGTRRFWQAYLEVAGVTDIVGAFTRRYTAANYQR